ncbi:MAG: tetratricopeptide repeat protein, partial [Candidatus Hydrogenedentes bacterium]|nr:tetratricopeptide repeat protein [Candidatus Hydrogenedentota bacterium]
WHDPGHDKELDSMVGRLFELERRADEKVPFPLRMSYTWQHIRPVRAIIVSGFGGMLTLYILAVIVRYIWEKVSDKEITVTPWFFTIFLLPWLWSLGQYGIALLSLRHEPEVFRHGIHHYDQGDFERAEQHFRRTLEIMPRHVPSLYLLIQLCAYRYEFDDAFKFCAQLAPFAPEEAENLQQELWTLKRLVARMES